MKKGSPQNAAFYQQVGANIKKFRLMRKLSQDALAKLIGLTRTSLTNIEHGRQHPQLHTLFEIVEQLKVDISELLPPRPTPREPIDLKKLAGSQVKGEDELAFIETAIGAAEAKSHDDTKEKNSGNGRKASR